MGACSSIIFEDPNKRKPNVLVKSISKKFKRKDTDPDVNVISENDDLTITDEPKEEKTKEKTPVELRREKFEKIHKEKFEKFKKNFLKEMDKEANNGKRFHETYLFPKDYTLKERKELFESIVEDLVNVQGYSEKSIQTREGTENTMSSIKVFF